MKRFGSPYDAYSNWKIWLLFRITSFLGICINVVPPYWLENSEKDTSRDTVD